MNRCDPANTTVPCKSKADIDEKLNGGLFAVYYKDLLIDPDDYKKPATGFRSTTFFMVSPDVYKEGYIFTKHI